MKRAVVEFKSNDKMVETRFNLRSSLCWIGFLFLAFLVVAFPFLAQTHEITLSLGGIPSQPRNFQGPAVGSTQISSDVSLGDTHFGSTARMNQRNEVESGANVKTGIAVLISFGLLTLASGQESRQTSDAVARPIGLEIGQPAPAFALMDQFGHEQSNKTLTGPKGTVLLFFRSADW